MLILAAAVMVALFVGALGFTLWTQHWGATAEERSMPMAGDDYLAGGPPARAVMTRSVTIDAPTETVWPWLAQLGRGAGWYSYDLLDNGSKKSARHIVSWVPPPQAGDASPVGYLRHIVPGSELTWWTPGLRFLGSFARLVFDIRLRPEGARSRLTIRMSADANEGAPRAVLSVFRFLDGVMARRELLGIQERVERHGARTANPEEPETGARDQYQHWEVVYASGERAGTPGTENAEQWRLAAIDAGFVSKGVSDDAA